MFFFLPTFTLNWAHHSLDLPLKSSSYYVSSKFPTFSANRNQCLPTELQRIPSSQISLWFSHPAIDSSSRIQSCLLKEWNETKGLFCLKPYYHPPTPEKSKLQNPVYYRHVFDFWPSDCFLISPLFSLIHSKPVLLLVSLTFRVYLSLEVFPKPVPWSHPLFREFCWLLHVIQILA